MSSLLRLHLTVAALLIATLISEIGAGSAHTVARAQATGPTSTHLQTATAIYLPIVVRNPTQPTATHTPSPTSMPTPTATTLPATPTEPIATPSAMGAASGIAVSQSAQAAIGSLRLVAASAIFYASQAANTGVTVTTGTLTVLNANEVTYDSAPTDRLRVNFADGRTLDLVVSEITGSDGSSPDAFLSSAHQMAVAIVTGPAVANPDPNLVLPPNVNVQLTSALANGATEVAVKGQIEAGGLPYTVDLTAQGSYFFDSSGGSVHRINDYTLTGTIVSLDATNLAATIDERYRHELIADSRTSVSTADSEIRNRWRYNGADYQLQNGLIRRSFQNGFVNESEIDSYWQASGQLLRDGQVIGGLGLNLNALYMEVFITVDGNERLLQRFRRPTTIVP